MEPLSPEEEKQRGLTRERLVEAALALVNDEGLEGLSMRALADRLDVKAASLYWHVRDRRELLDLLADSILDGVRAPRSGPDWRKNVLAAGSGMAKAVAAQKDSGRILLEAPEALRRSDVFHGVVDQLGSAGLSPTEASDVGLMVMTHAIAGQVSADEPIAAGAGSIPASIAIDSGSRGVELRAGPRDMQGLIRVPHDRAGAAPAVVRGETVVVRRLRGVGRGEIELNPRRPWNFKVQAPTWNTRLDLDGLDVRGIWIDSGAANLECFLPQPKGVVPIHVSSGVVNVTMHRARGAAVIALAHPGVLKLRLEDYSTKVTVLDVNWQSSGALEARDRYELDLSSGVVDFTVDSYTPSVTRVDAGPAEEKHPGKPASALEILLDGVQARVKARG